MKDEPCARSCARSPAPSSTHRPAHTVQRTSTGRRCRWRSVSGAVSFDRLGALFLLEAARILLVLCRPQLAQRGKHRIALASDLVLAGGAIGLGIGLERFPDDFRLGIVSRLALEHALAGY